MKVKIACMVQVNFKILKNGFSYPFLYVTEFRKITHMGANDTVNI